MIECHILTLRLCYIQLKQQLQIINEYCRSKIYLIKISLQAGSAAMKVKKQPMKRSLAESKVTDATKPAKISKTVKSNIVKAESKDCANQMTSDLAEVQEVSNTNEESILEVEMISQEQPKVVIKKNKSIIKSTAMSDLVSNQPPKNIQNVAKYKLDIDVKTSTPKRKHVEATTQNEKFRKEIEEKQKQKNYTKESIEQPVSEGKL